MNSFHNNLERAKVWSLYKKDKLTMTKKWYTSRTLWVGILEVIIGISTVLTGQLEAGTAITLFGVLQIALRVITRSSLIR